MKKKAGNTMTMDKAEIVIDYKAARNKKSQIEILAQLNGCSKMKIAQIIHEAGEPLPEPFRSAFHQTGERLKRGAKAKDAETVDGPPRASAPTERKDGKPQPGPADDPNVIPATKPEEPKDAKPEATPEFDAMLENAAAKVRGKRPPAANTGDLVTREELDAAVLEAVCKARENAPSAGQAAGGVGPCTGDADAKDGGKAGHAWMPETVSREEFRDLYEQTRSMMSVVEETTCNGYKGIFEQVASLTEAVKEAQKELDGVNTCIEGLTEVVKQLIETSWRQEICKLENTYAEQEIRAAAFEVMVREVQSGDSAPAKREAICIVTETVRQLLEILQSGTEAARKEAG